MGGDIEVDVTDADGIASAVMDAAARLGGLDTVINNAGIGAQGTVEENDDDEWRHVYDVNVLGMVRVARAALPHLREAGGGAIVNTCSVAATAGLPNRALYSASKGAVMSLTLAMAADHVSEGIRVNCVAPGTADTPWVGRLLDAADDPDAERAALERAPADGPARVSRRGRRGDRYLATSTATTGTMLVRRRRDAGTAPARARAMPRAWSSLRTLRRENNPALASLLERVAALAPFGLGLGELGAQLGGVTAGGVERGAQLDRVGAGGVDRPAVWSSSLRSVVLVGAGGFERGRAAHRSRRPRAPSARITSTGLRRVPSRGARAARSSSVETCGSVR